MFKIEFQKPAQKTLQGRARGRPPLSVVNCHPKSYVETNLLIHGTLRYVVEHHNRLQLCSQIKSGEVGIEHICCVSLILDRGYLKTLKVRPPVTEEHEHEIRLTTCQNSLANSQGKSSGKAGVVQICLMKETHHYPNTTLDA